MRSNPTDEKNEHFAMCNAKRRILDHRWLATPCQAVSYGRDKDDLMSRRLFVVCRPGCHMVICADCLVVVHDRNVSHYTHTHTPFCIEQVSQLHSFWFRNKWFLNRTNLNRHGIRYSRSCLSYYANKKLNRNKNNEKFAAKIESISLGFDRNACWSWHWMFILFVFIYLAGPSSHCAHSMEIALAHEDTTH